MYDTKNSSNIHTIREDNKIYDNSSKLTNYTVRGLYWLFDGETNVSNIYLNSSPFVVAHTSFLLIIHSDDDGVTWSDPVELNYYLK